MAMSRETEKNILEFCVAQKGIRSLDAWMDAGRKLGNDALAVSAAFLANCAEWYGNQDFMREVALALSPELGANFPAAVKKTDFDCSRFSSMLRQQLQNKREI